MSPSNEMSAGSKCGCGRLNMAVMHEANLRNDCDAKCKGDMILVRNIPGDKVDPPVDWYSNAKSAVRRAANDSGHKNKAVINQFGEDPRRPKRKAKWSSPSTSRAKSAATKKAAKGAESAEAQIRKFKQRSDLRDCMLPGMLSGISREACEGWQTQTNKRSSRIMAKVKLEPCLKCRFFILPPDELLPTNRKIA